MFSLKNLARKGSFILIRFTNIRTRISDYILCFVRNVKVNSFPNLKDGLIGSMEWMSSYVVLFYLSIS